MRPDGCTALAGALRKNGTLRELRLGNNWVGNQVSKWVSKCEVPRCVGVSHHAGHRMLVLGVGAQGMVWRAYSCSAVIPLSLAGLLAGLLADVLLGTRV